jgi:hypothetical protein
MLTAGRACGLNLEAKLRAHTRGSAVGGVVQAFVPGEVTVVTADSITGSTRLGAARNSTKFLRLRLKTRTDGGPSLPPRGTPQLSRQECSVFRTNACDLCSKAAMWCLCPIDTEARNGRSVRKTEQRPSDVSDEYSLIVNAQKITCCMVTHRLFFAEDSLVYKLKKSWKGGLARQAIGTRP